MFHPDFLTAIRQTAICQTFICQIVVCELNTGQFATYLRSQFPELPIEQYNEIQGQPFAVERIVNFVKQ